MGGRAEQEETNLTGVREAGRDYEGLFQEINWITRENYDGRSTPFSNQIHRKPRRGKQCQLGWRKRWEVVLETATTSFQRKGTLRMDLRSGAIFCSEWNFWSRKITGSKFLLGRKSLKLVLLDRVSTANVNLGRLQKRVVWTNFIIPKKIKQHPVLMGLKQATTLARFREEFEKMSACMKEVFNGMLSGVYLSGWKSKFKQKWCFHRLKHWGR